MIRRIIKKLWAWIRHWLWKVPTSKPAPLKAAEVIDQWTVIKYRDQNICLHKNEIPLWNKLDRKDRRAMANKFKRMEEKGKIRFESINGKLVAIKNKDYNAMVEK